jgi:uncharacterized membrane protein YqjE
MKLQSLFGLGARVRRVRIVVREGALAAEDRMQLLRMALDEEKHRYREMLLLMVAVIGLTTVSVALVSVALVVHFWDTPYRVTSAWLVAALWIVLWLVAVSKLMRALTGARGAVEATRQEFARDWSWIRHRLGAGHHEDEPAEPRPVTHAELLARIERQRLRIMTLEGAGPADLPGAPPQDETAGAAALRLAREHPVATGVAAAAVVAVLGPRRLVRWAAVVAPVLWRMR